MVHRWGLESFYLNCSQVPFIEDLVNKRSGDLQIYTSMPAVLALKKNLSEETLKKVSFVPIKNTSRPVKRRDY